MIEDLTAKYVQTAEASGKIGWAVHHSATQTETDPPRSVADELAVIERIDRFHKEDRGWSMGFGYHVAVFDSGRAYRVGKSRTVRAHVANLNHLYDGLCIIGTYEPDYSPSTEALDTAAAIIAGSGLPFSGGHRDVMAAHGRPNYTTCPGGWDLSLLTRRLERAAPEAPPPDRVLIALDHIEDAYASLRAAEGILRRGSDA